MARLYTDENFPQPVVDALRQLGHDLLTSNDAGNAGNAIPDEAVLAFAIDDQRALLTLNRLHFIRLHNASANHSGIIICTFDPDFVEQAQRINRLLNETDTLTGRLLRVNRPNP